MESLPLRIMADQPPFKRKSLYALAALSTKRGRGKEEELKKTLLFIVGHQPYKETLMLPVCRFLTCREVDAAAAEQHEQLIPYEVDGEFESVVSLSSLRVAVFRFRNTTRCSNTHSEAHRSLPPAGLQYCMIETVMKNVRVTIKVGSAFLYNGLQQPYTITDSVIGMEPPRAPAVSRVRPSEPEIVRTAHMMQGLRQALAMKDYTVSPCWDTRHYSPFSGGENISIFKKTSSAVAAIVLQTIPSDMDTPSDADVLVSPPERGEYRCISIENKVSGADDQKITLQLQANMLLLCSTLLLKMLEECSAEEAADINILTCYGLQNGLNCLLKVLKLSFDFTTGRQECVEIFSIPPSPYLHVYVDVALQYIISIL